MFRSILKAIELNHRLDSSHYHPTSMSAERQLRAFGSLVALREMVDTARPITNGVRGPDLQPSQFRLIRLQDCDGFFINFENCLTISETQFNENRRCAVRENDVIVAIGGYIGNASVATKVMPSVIGQHSALLANSKNFDSFYLAAYLNSRIGALQFQRYVSGTVQQGINLEDIREILVPAPLQRTQIYIGDKVRQAERLRSLGSQMMRKARGVIELINDGQLLAADLEEDHFIKSPLIDRVARPQTQIDAKHDRVNSRLLGDRIDSWFYKPEFVRGDSQLQIIRDSGIKTPSLESFASVSYGFMPTEDYWSSGEGALFLRVTNIQDNLRLDLSKIEYVNPTLSKSPRYRLKEDDIVCVQCGNSTGRIALISSRCNDWVFPSFALRIRLKDKEWDAAYVAGYLASWLGQSQIQRTISITSVRPNTTKPAIEAVTVPKLPLRTQQLIGKQLRFAINCVEQSVPLCDAAQLIVEAMIDRKITEDELVHAQTLLEQGDDSADRAILSRIFQGGLDATETRPLFPDLDDYFETLRMVERAQTEVTAK